MDERSPGNRERRKAMKLRHVMQERRGDGR
jgi:hypothetical protein